MKLSHFESQKIKVYLKDGSTLEGFGFFRSSEYCDYAFGIDTACLQICDYLIRENEIDSVERITASPSIRSTEEDMAMLFSVKRSFSEHLKRWEDNELPDKDDHNCFEYSGQPTREEFERALNLQMDRGDRFIKLEGDHPLRDAFGLSESVTLTMEFSGCADSWIVNDTVQIRKPDLKDLREIELKHYGPVYGDVFTVRNIDHLVEYLDFRGAYEDQKLVGAYYFFTSNGFTCVDGLIVDRDYRRRHIATTLLKHAVREAAGNTVFLHADENDSPRELYEKLGFHTVDRLYEYLSTEI